MKVPSIIVASTACDVNGTAYNVRSTELNYNVRRTEYNDKSTEYNAECTEYNARSLLNHLRQLWFSIVFEFLHLLSSLLTAKATQKYHKC